MEKLLRNYQLPLIGAAIGLIFAISLITFGFWKTLLAILLTAGGFYLALKFSQTDIYHSLQKQFNKKGNK